jgi:hypothetical protein
VDGELARLDALTGAGLSDEFLRQRCALSRRDHPADYVAAEDVEDHVEVEVRPLRRALELGYVP